MTPQRISIPEVVTVDDLKDLAAAGGPCITVALEIPEPNQIRTRIKNSIRDVEKGLQNAGVDERHTAALMEPIQTLASGVEAEGQWRRDVVLFCSPKLFRHFSVLELTREFVDVAAHFQIRPLLSGVGLEQQFYILALSQNHIRLLRCTHYRVEDVQLRGAVPENLETWMNTRIPDHVLDNRAAGGPSTGAMKGVMFGTSTDRERRSEHLAHFFREIDSGLRRILGSGEAPLILAGVASETALYARVNTYARLLEDNVPGSPEKLSPLELHQRAMKIIRHTFTESLSRALLDIDERRGTGLVVTDTEAVLQTAYEGRVAGLLVREDAEQRGEWDEATQQVRPGNQDLLNLAALRTLSYGGHAFALKASDMPEAAGMVALLRF